MKRKIKTLVTGLVVSALIGQTVLAAAGNHNI